MEFVSLALTSNATTETLQMEMAAETSASLGIFGVALVTWITQYLIVTTRVQYNATMKLCKMERTATPHSSDSAAAHANLLSVAMGK